ncbi:uncharacterized protein B0H18DRAFT_1119011 [Fomitopsis serialis]|uniref:uncharacterized protein n=1 Tax=Fomitopsis serialis TaxID=139415 RepID=UPI00200779C1|nr:uncharacterized protein B0H18DRAFT_1119011 [Neoantrodia serialis]KAH9926106.1 hypothetical protein B0H18DRAFT_1119011 [Neoantrodia serialis]
MPPTIRQATAPKQSLHHHQETPTVKPRQFKAWSPSESHTLSPSTPLAPSLPTLRLPMPESLAVTIRVEGIPERNGIVLTWIVDERPVRQVERGLPIVLVTGDLRTGVGRVENATDIHRHWITWLLTGSPTACAIRVPTSWSRLTRDESQIHTQLYTFLPRSPPPHRLLANNPDICNSAESPYEFDSEDDSL